MKTLRALAVAVRSRPGHLLYHVLAVSLSTTSYMVLRGIYEVERCICAETMRWSWNLGSVSRADVHAGTCPSTKSRKQTFVRLKSSLINQEVQSSRSFRILHNPYSSSSSHSHNRHLTRKTARSREPPRTSRPNASHSQIHPVNTPFKNPIQSHLYPQSAI